ncbi:TetR/AcrR family transcriptional regulator [Escherichia coli]|uniref:TetR/AcrR family transcriptional regulator n=1 Tax=Escherichia coli TaxID=562 RepID=UPI001A989AAA
MQAAFQEAERGGPEAINISALAKKLGVSQPAPYRHFADREALLEAVTAEAFRQFNVILKELIDKPSKQSKLSRFAQATLAFGLQRNGIYGAGRLSGDRQRDLAASGEEERDKREHRETLMRACFAAMQQRGKWVRVALSATAMGWGVSCRKCNHLSFGMLNSLQHPTRDGRSACASCLSLADSWTPKQVGVYPLGPPDLGHLQQAPIVEHPVVQPVLIDGGQFAAQPLVQIIDDLRVALHDPLHLSRPNWSALNLERF